MEKRTYSSLAEMIEKADQGDLDAMYSVVQEIELNYADDREIQARLLNYLNILTDAGDYVSMITLAGHYENGKGTEQNIPKAMELYEIAAKNGYKFAYGNL